MTKTLDTSCSDMSRNIAQTLRQLADAVERGYGIGELTVDIEREEPARHSWREHQMRTSGRIVGARWRLDLRTIGPLLVGDSPIPKPIVDQDRGDEDGVR